MNTQKVKLKYNYYSIRNVKYLGRNLTIMFRTSILRKLKKPFLEKLKRVYISCLWFRKSNIFNLTILPKLFYNYISMQSQIKILYFLKKLTS